ncbi:hypothetical protein HPP92_009364 [Vanilla planifolia]|uniref:Uncharacterized protein n=1 Tax=Vanilla planifolia TaxID=51239 RepID=A0A835R4D7_VANPL|nr:hypothetical protein HPP92_009364 [Vanilla planifolia]
MADDKKIKAKKGCLVVAVDGEESGGSGSRRFLIPISHLHHPLFLQLLEAARDTYGYRLEGPLRLPCSADDFLRLQMTIERDIQQHAGVASHLSLPLPLSRCFSFQLYPEESMEKF